MSTTINSIPQELLIEILKQAALLNLELGSKYSYGLGHTPEHLHNAGIHTVVRGQLSPDVLMWNATCDIRQVSRRWHDWACHYALRRLYISRWRGSERWLESRALDTPQMQPSGVAVYRDPYCALRKTAHLFANSPSLTPYVRSIWFNGYYGVETNTMIFDIIRSCEALEHLTLPWTSLRYGDAEVWSRLLKRNTSGRSLCSLEFLAIDLKNSQIANPANQIDRKPLDFAAVTFQNLKRLKIFGTSNHMAFTDSDLFKISRTAHNLQEIHITGTASFTISGVMALATASRNSLQILEHSLLSPNESNHQKNFSAEKPTCFCQEISQFPKLTDLTLSLPTVCANLFHTTSINWSGETQIRADSLCKETPNPTSQALQTSLRRILNTARSLMHTRKLANAELNIEISIKNWLFVPRQALVHGPTLLGETLSDGLWPTTKSPSSRGPCGFLMGYGNDEGGYACVGEEEFMRGLERGWVRL